MPEPNEKTLTVDELEQVTCEAMAVLATVLHTSATVLKSLTGDARKTAAAVAQAPDHNPETVAELEARAAALDAMVKGLREGWEASSVLFQESAERGAQCTPKAALDLLLMLGAPLGIETALRDMLLAKAREAAAQTGGN